MGYGSPKEKVRRSWLDPGAGPVVGRVGLWSLLALGLLACGPEGDASGEGGPAAEEEATQADPTAGPGDPVALGAEGWLGDVSTGRAVDPRGAVPAESGAREFAPGEVIYVSMEVGDAPADAAVHVVFYDPAGDKVAEDEKKVPAEARYLYFDSGDTRHWEPGGYRVETSVGGEVVDEQELALVESPPA